MSQYQTNKAGVAQLDKRGQRIPDTSKPTTGRTIGQNIAVTGTYVKKAVSHDSVLSGGVNE
jgi:hypothetical protein